MEPLDQGCGNVGVGRDAVVWRGGNGWMERGRGGRVRKAKQNTHQVTTPLIYVRADGRAPDAHVGLDGVGDPIHLDFPRTAGRRSDRASSKGGRRQKGDHRLEAEEQGHGDDDRTLHLVEELTEGKTKRAYVDVWGGGMGVVVRMCESCLATAESNVSSQRFKQQSR